MTNLGCLSDATLDLPPKRRDLVEQYLLGILSIKVSANDWQTAVRDAVAMEARINGPKEAANAHN